MTPSLVWAVTTGWSVSIWGRNLTDENNGMIGEDIFGTYGVRDTLPRTYGVEFAYNF